MSDDGILRRFPSALREGNGIKITYSGGVPTIGTDLDTLSVTPAGAVAPVNLASTLATLIAHDSADRNIINVSDGYFDIPGSGNGYSISDGYF